MITQQINLYQAEFRPRKLAFSARSTALACIALITLLTLLSAYGQWQHGRAATALTATQAELARWQARSADLQALLARINADNSIDIKIGESQARLAALRQVLAYLEQVQAEPEHRFSAYLSGLARRRTDGVWLTRVGIAGDGRDLEIVGAALDPALLPRFITALSEEDSYRGHRFRNLKIERPQAQAAAVEFRLSTQPAGSP